MSSDEELVPGDEDEQGIGEEEEESEITCNESKKKERKLKKSKKTKQRSSGTNYRPKRRLASSENPSNLYSNSDPVVYSKRPKSQKLSKDNENDISLPKPLPLDNEEENSSDYRLISPSSDQTRKLKSVRKESSPMKLSKGIRKTSHALLRKTGTLSDINERKSKKKVEENDLVEETLFMQFQRTLFESDSSLLRVILQHATCKQCSEGTQKSLLISVSELLLIPDSGVQTYSQIFLSSYFKDDLKTGNFNKNDWEIFYGKNEPGEVSKFGSLAIAVERICWWHIAQAYLIIILSKSSFFRSSFNSLVKRLEKNAASSRKKHKIFPILFSFFSGLFSSKEEYPLIFIDTLKYMKEILSEEINLPPLDGMFRIFVLAVSSLIHNPRRWSFDTGIELSPFMRKTLQNISEILEQSLLEKNYECNNQIESSLVESIATQIRDLLTFCTNPIPDDQKLLPRIMTWSDSKASTAVLYNHLTRNFDSIWSYIIYNDPDQSYILSVFAMLTLLVK